MKTFYNKYKNYIKGILSIFLFFTNSLFSVIPMTLFHLNPNKLTEKQNLLLGIFNYVILVVIYILLYRKDLIKYSKDFKKNMNKNIDIGFKYWIIGLFFMVISNIILMKIWPNNSAANEDAVQLYIKSFPFLALISTSILGPFIEEIVFRKTFKDMFKKPAIFILTSGIIFGLMHVLGQANTFSEFLYFIPYSALGISFAYMYYKSENFLTPCMMHFFHNFVLTLISILSIGL